MRNASLGNDLNKTNHAMHRHWIVVYPMDSVIQLSKKPRLINRLHLRRLATGSKVITMLLNSRFDSGTIKGQLSPRF